MTKEALQQIELDRTNDAVYTATTGVARVVIDMIRGVQQAQADKYVELVKVSDFQAVLVLRLLRYSSSMWQTQLAARQLLELVVCMAQRQNVGLWPANFPVLRLTCS